MLKGTFLVILWYDGLLFTKIAINQPISNFSYCSVFKFISGSCICKK